MMSKASFSTEELLGVLHTLDIPVATFLEWYSLTSKHIPNGLFRKLFEEYSKEDNQAIDAGFDISHFFMYMWAAIWAPDQIRTIVKELEAVREITNMPAGRAVFIKH